MSIKRRLYVSNLLMLFLPLVFLMLASIIMYFTFIGTSGSDIGTSPADESLHRPYIYLGLLLIIVLIINVFLTRFIIKSIMNPIESLRTGVHEIRDGNLEYHIEYAREDEFSAVCDDFNEMADRLSTMVQKTQEDERSRRELIAGISHDLRTPLTSIKAYLEGIEKGVAATPEMEKKYLETIMSKTENLEYIINQLFIFSNLDIGEFPLERSCVNMVDLLKRIVDNAEHEYQKEGLDISYRGNEKALYCAIDIVQFENVIQNIIVNSLKYKDSTRIESRVSCRAEGESALICIADNGPGVSHEAIAKLFNILYREDEARQESDKGSGIGHAISSKIIEKLGGTISAQNRSTGGLEIQIELPLQDNENNFAHIANTKGESYA